MENQCHAPDRANWISLLAKAPGSILAEAVAQYGELPQYEWLRRPETGLAMVRARAGGTGGQFNLGEMSLTRCAVRLNTGQMGIAYVAGRDARHAEWAAVFDALMQTQDNEKVRETVLRPIERACRATRTGEGASAGNQSGVHDHGERGGRMNAVTDDTLLPAWTDSVHAAQATFRAVLKAMSEPALQHAVPAALAGPAPLHASTTALCLALLDLETPVWRDEAAQTPGVAAYLRFHCGCPLTTDPAAAAFALIANPGALSFERFATGSMEYPDRSTTLLVQVPTLVDGPPRVVSGPGIAQTCTLRVGGLREDFDAMWRDNAAGFPLGVDIFFCCGNDIIGLPRTARIHDQGSIVEQSPCM